MINHVQHFHDIRPAEARALEAELLPLFARGRVSEDVGCEEVFQRYPTHKDFQNDPRRSLFIQPLFEMNGFKVRYSQDDLRGWIVK